jgi:hypothetical protein
MYTRIAWELVAIPWDLGTAALSEQRVTEEGQLLCQFVNNKPAAVTFRHLLLA